MMDVKKLPKWAQEHIEDLSRERDNAIRKLNEVLDTQTESPFYYDEYVCTGEEQGPTSKRVYLQTHKIKICANGINMEVLLRDDEKSIDLSWDSTLRGMAEVAFIPLSLNRAKLATKENMR